METAMSSTILRIIPATPSFIPSVKHIKKALSRLHAFYNNRQIDYNIFDTIEFIDQGENFDNVSCDKCDVLIDIEMWQDAMDKAYKTKFENLDFITPCCNKNTSLNNLNYHSPAGFSKFIININDADKDLDNESLQELEMILGSTLKLLWAHY